MDVVPSGMSTWPLESGVIQQPARTPGIAITSSNSVASTDVVNRTQKLVTNRIFHIAFVKKLEHERKIAKK
jgi:hypothetical protein